MTFEERTDDCDSSRTPSPVKSSSPTSTISSPTRTPNQATANENVDPLANGVIDMDLGRPSPPLATDPCSNTAQNATDGGGQMRGLGGMLPAFLRQTPGMEPRMGVLNAEGIQSHASASGSTLNANFVTLQTFGVQLQNDGHIVEGTQDILVPNLPSSLNADPVTPQSFGLHPNHLAASNLPSSLPPETRSKEPMSPLPSGLSADHGVGDTQAENDGSAPNSPSVASSEIWSTAIQASATSNVQVMEGTEEVPTRNLLKKTPITTGRPVLPSIPPSGEEPKAKKKTQSQHGHGHGPKEKTQSQEQLPRPFGRHSRPVECNYTT